MRYDEEGRELPDDTPVEVPLKFRRAIPEHERIKEYVRTELSRQAAEVGDETFEEANDFDVDDDMFEVPHSVHQLTEADEDDMMVARRDFLDEQQRSRDDGDRSRSGSSESREVGQARRSGDSGVSEVRGSRVQSESGEGDVGQRKGRAKKGSRGGSEGVEQDADV